MGKLRILSGKGDHTVVWDKEKAETGDPEAVAAVREAERIFEEQLRRGATAFRVAPDAPAQRIGRFLPEADEMVVVPQVIGG